MEYIRLRNLVGGNPDHPAIDAKGMQSRMLCMFARWLLHTHVRRFKQVSEEMFAKATGLLKSADCLRAWYEIVHSHGPQVPEEACALAVSLAKKHITLWAAHSGSSPKPKHHGLYELSRSMRRAGNPKDWTCHSDETLNSTVAKLTKTVHPRLFAISLLKKYFLRRTLDGAPF